LIPNEFIEPVTLNRGVIEIFPLTWKFPVRIKSPPPTRETATDAVAAFSANDDVTELLAESA
jgi:hypothetical protein